MNRKTALWALMIIVILVSSSLLIVWTFIPAENREEEEVVDAEFFVGVQLGYGGVDDCKALIDKVKDYTNLFVISSYDVTQSNVSLNEVCDYMYEAGLSFVIYFQAIAPFYKYNTHNWTIQAKETYGDQYLGEYILDEIGGRQLDRGFPSVYNAYNYNEYSNKFVESIQQYGKDYLQSGGEDFTSDYALYWFDYKAGYDAVLAQFGWNQSRQMQISQCRGAAKVQNKDWGAMITWTYNHPPYLESGAELYDDLLLAYHSGAKYAVIFNHDEDEPYSGYGIMTEEHFEALENFWNYKNDNPKKHGSLTADVAFVLPQDYGFGSRDPDDKVWGLWNEHFSPKIWNQVTDLLDEYGSRLDIVYSEEEYADRIDECYSTIFRWEFEAADGFPVQNLNTSLGYPTIQAAIDSGYTLDGHVIHVNEGIYYENLNIDKSVALIGEGRETTIIDGGNKWSAVYVRASANITGFTIRNGNSALLEDDSSTFYLSSGILIDKSSNCCIVGNDIIDNNCGICLKLSGNITLRDNNIANNNINIIVEGDSLSHFINDIDASNTVNGKTVHYLVNEKNLNIDSSFSDMGFLALVNCTNMTVKNLSLDNNGQGILLAGTTNSTVTSNVVTNNREGVRMFASSGNVFRNNSISDNVYNLWIQNGVANDIDISNTVDGKPIIYWVNQQNRTVPVDAGYVVLINCTDIVAQNVNISDHRQGILLVSTTNSSIIESDIATNYYGIQLENCTDISITGNSVKNNRELGVYLQWSNNSIISNNVITRNEVGIQIGSIALTSDDTNMGNQIVGNNITDNSYGIINKDAKSVNTFYHNNFINNTDHVSYNFNVGSNGETILIAWDDGVEGNYWSDYDGNDTNHDGIIDAECSIVSIMGFPDLLQNGTLVYNYFNVTDHYPLSGMFSSFTQSGQTFNVISNSTIESFQYSQAEGTITLQATTEGFGFCRIAIPHTAMDVDSISVEIDGRQVQAVNTDYQVYDDGNCRWIYFAYPEGTQEIQITSQQQ